MNNINNLKDGLVKLGVSVCGTTKDFDGSEGGLWVTLEEGSLEQFSSTFSDEYVNSPINKYIENMGYYIEEYDPGTAMIWSK